MFISPILPVLCMVSLAAAKMNSHFGWLDRLVAYHKKNFLEDLARIPTPLTVRVEPAPPGFVDAPGWDKASVMRLIMLVEVLNARPVRQAIRRALSPSRRIYLPPGMNLFDIMPDWSKNAPNDYYYEDALGPPEMSDLPPHKKTTLSDETVVYISNPIEAHLPSSRVTVKLLRQIMEARAVGLREMPTTERSTMSHVSKSKTTTHQASETTAGTTEGHAESEGTSASAAGGDETGTATGETGAETGSETAAETSESPAA